MIFRICSGGNSYDIESVILHHRSNTTTIVLISLPFFTHFPAHAYPSATSASCALTALPKSTPAPPPVLLFSLKRFFCDVLHFLAFFSISSGLSCPKKSPSILLSPLGCEPCGGKPGGAPNPGGADMMHRVFDEESESVERKSSTSSGGNTSLDRDEGEGKEGGDIRRCEGDNYVALRATAFTLFGFATRRCRGPICRVVELSIRDGDNDHRPGVLVPSVPLFIGTPFTKRIGERGTFCDRTSQVAPHLLLAVEIPFARRHVTVAFVR